MSGESDTFQNEHDETIKHKRGFRLPPDDFTYGLKHPERGPVTGVAAGLYLNMAY